MNWKEYLNCAYIYNNVFYVLSKINIKDNNRLTYVYKIVILL